MCGMCGILDQQHRLAPIATMNQTQAHRGPDDEGYLFINTSTADWCLAGGPDTPEALQLISHKMVNTDNYDLVLGSRRLAILDLSPAGHMPMSYLNGKLWLAYNGEIYNYRELRQELQQLGHTFMSDADTEVVLAAYAEWGVDALSRFNGMFGFALWDAREQRLFCARDRFGIKPFYYFWDGSTFVFASEIKSILQHEAVPKEPNDETIFDYLTLGLSDHADRTFFKDISPLPPSHFLIVDVPNKRLTTQRWWQADINPNISHAKNGKEQQVYEEFATLLEDAVRLRLRSDVAVGSCLSGGLDSSTIVCLANQLLLEEQVIPDNLVGNHQKTFTARNQEAEIDEYIYSSKIVKQTGAEENLVFPNGERLWQEIESFVYHMDEPVDSTSQYPQWNVMRLAKERGVTVLLDGQGGDEILAGYYAYYPPYLSQLKQQLGLFSALKAGLEVTRVGGSPVFDRILQNASYQLPWRVQQAIKFLRPPRALPGGGGSGLQSWQLSEAFIQQFWDKRWQPSSVGSDGLVGVLYRDLTSTNLPKLLRFEDRNSMAFSLETRLPFLDYRLVEMVFSLPLNYRINKGWSKWILRRSMSDLLPPEICWRRSKLGFPVPEKTWLQQGSGYIRQLLRDHDNQHIASYLQPGALQKMADLSDEELANTSGLWRITNLLLWLDTFINQKRQPLNTGLPERPSMPVL